ncbi:hypothetical protein Mmc1_2930 [Magnetococcus marinus MC-1]|uniref:Uracil-DNA glycosylase n=1 Tax=Magnetococcus marinus (strain ATCC BAA-1437 / JCM 17883 / MC-1) TaxID=156889 RepID=A0LBS8_MAGMM|nr:hypothetical protein Mmc1_2930 [Magnetococcus marinus MC-1]
MHKHPPQSAVNCMKCQYFRITWNPTHPRACSALGFKGREMPSTEVLRASGQPCLLFTPKPSHNHSHTPKDHTPNGWYG